MPQMSPMWWTTISMWTIFCLMMFIYINYFYYSPNVKMNMKMHLKKFNWKW
uniref:ATP synthase F0 subunit 8 n=1 Tax=Chanohirata hamata TaxID=3032134 RepID=A0A7G8JRX9_9HEMI|nr:ATP synthase F0 subunit 8 [Chanohirata hamata]QNJ33327.1 ATP synthase F0 subunit 8 [Chanohirata hamata]